jgi:NAD(P)H-nitrite reductase large subunit
MNRKAKNGPKDRVVCFCYNVTESTIIEAIRAGCSSLTDIRLHTYASTGCAGCAEEVKKLLRKYASRPDASAPPKDPKVSNG